jgi:hypothetical protein
MICDEPSVSRLGASNRMSNQSAEGLQMTSQRFERASNNQKRAAGVIAGLKQREIAQHMLLIGGGEKRQSVCKANGTWTIHRDNLHWLRNKDRSLWKSGWDCRHNCSYGR